MSENLDILDIDILIITKLIEDKSREVLVDNKNVENKIGPEGDVRWEERWLRKKLRKGTKI